MIHPRFFSALALVLLFVPLAWGQSEDAQGNSADDSEKIKAEKKQSINFEDELIEGQSQKPDLFYMFQKQNFKFKKLIKLRENFLPEMQRNAEDVQRLRGGR